MARTCLFWASTLLGETRTGSLPLPFAPDATAGPLAACAAFLGAALGPERPATARAFTGALGADGSADDLLVVGGVCFALDVERPAFGARSCVIASLTLVDATLCGYPAWMIPLDSRDGGIDRGDGAPSGCCLAGPVFGRRRLPGNGGNANGARANVAASSAGGAGMGNPNASRPRGAKTQRYCGGGGPAAGSVDAGMGGVGASIGPWTPTTTGPAVGRKGFLVGGPEGSVSVGPVVGAGLVASTVGADSPATGASREMRVGGDASSFSSPKSDSNELERLRAGRGLFSHDGTAVGVGRVSDWLGVTGSFEWRSATWTCPIGRTDDGLGRCRARWDASKVSGVAC